MVVGPASGGQTRKRVCARATERAAAAAGGTTERQRQDLLFRVDEEVVAGDELGERGLIELQKAVSLRHVEELLHDQVVRRFEQILRSQRLSERSRSQRRVWTVVKTHPDACQEALARATSPCRSNVPDATTRHATTARHATRWRARVANVQVAPRFARGAYRAKRYAPGRHAGRISATSAASARHPARARGAQT